MPTSLYPTTAAVRPSLGVTKPHKFSSPGPAALLPSPFIFCRTDCASSRADIQILHKIESLPVKGDIHGIFRTNHQRGLRHRSDDQSLEHDNRETRSALKELFKDPLFTPRYAITLPEERELALARLKAICADESISVRDFIHNPHRIFSVHETVGMMDGSVATKMTVQFNLFGGTVLKLGTEHHHEGLLDAIDSLDSIGCFGLTELGLRQQRSRNEDHRDLRY